MTVELNPRQKHAMKTMKRYRRTIVTGYLASGKTTVLMEFAKKWSKKNSGGVVVVCTFPIRQFQVYKRSLEHLPYVYFWNKNDPWTGPANETSLFLVDQANDLQDTELDQILEIYERSDAIDIDCKLVLAGGYPRMTGTYYEMMSDPSYARVSL